MSAHPERLDTLGLSVEEVAAAAEVSVDTARAWRDGTTVPRPAQAARLAGGLGLPLERLRPDLTPLAAELARRGLSGRDLAARAGVHENSVYAWLSGRVIPSRAAADKIAATLGVPAARLFHGLPTPLREAMTDRRLSARRLAAAAGVMPKTVSELAAGKHPPTRQVAGRLAAALDVGVERLFPKFMAAQPTPLAAELARRGMSDGQLARAAGAHKNSVQGWTAGAHTPAPGKAARVAAALGLPVEEVFPNLPARQERVELARRLARPAATVDPLDPLDTPDGTPTLAVILSRLATGDPRWREQAVCAAPDADPEQWWPDRLDDPATHARQACGGCPVLGDCRDAYLADPRLQRDAAEGIWGGTRGRILTLAANRQPAPQLQPDPRPAGRLGEVMAARQLSAKRLGALAGVHHTTVSKWLAGTRQPTRETAERIADTLHLHIDQLLPNGGHDHRGGRDSEDEEGARTAGRGSRGERDPRRGGAHQPARSAHEFTRSADAAAPDPRPVAPRARSPLAERGGIAL